MPAFKYFKLCLFIFRPISVSPQVHRGSPRPMFGDSGCRGARLCPSWPRGRTVTEQPHPGAQPHLSPSRAAPAAAPSLLSRQVKEAALFRTCARPTVVPLSEDKIIVVVEGRGWSRAFQWAKSLSTSRFQRSVSAETTFWSLFCC